MVTSVNIWKTSLFVSKKDNDWEVPKSMKKALSKRYLQLWNITLNDGEQPGSVLGILSCQFSFNVN